MTKVFMLTIACPVDALSFVVETLSAHKADLIDARLVDETPSMRSVPEKRMGALELVHSAITNMGVGQSVKLSQIQQLLIMNGFSKHSGSARLSELIRAGAIAQISQGMFKVIKLMPLAEAKAKAFPHRKRN